MTIPFKIKLLTSTAKAPTKENDGDLWDLYADDFKLMHDGYVGIPNSVCLGVGKRVLVKTGISIELPSRYSYWSFNLMNTESMLPKSYAAADIRPRSGMALKHGITVLNSPGTIDNSYRKEIGVILYNAGKFPYVISQGDKVAQMWIRELEPSQMEIVTEIAATERGGFGSTGK